MPAWFDLDGLGVSYEGVEPEELEEGIFLERIYGKQEAAAEGTEEDSFLFGTPEMDERFWCEQSEVNSSPIACQKMIVEQFLQTEISERQMIEFAQKKGYYSQEGGMPKADIGKMFNAYGLRAEMSADVSLDELAVMLDSEEKLICLVNDLVLACPEADGLCGLSANHAIQVIGLDLSDPQNGKVILNDPGSKAGKGAHCEINRFLKAWKAGRGYTISVHGRSGDEDS